MAVYADNRAWSYLEDTKSISNASYIYSWFTSRGWSRNAVLGLIGNTTWECYNNPAYTERNGYGGFGIVQWTPSSNYTTWARKNGYPCDTDYSNPEKYLVGQLERIMYEYRNGLEFSWDSRRSHVYRTRFDGLTWEKWIHNTESLAWSTEAFMSCYERPSYTLHHLDDRIRFAGIADGLFDAASDEQATTYAQQAVEWAVAIADDPSHGYDQINREGPDYDCSSLVINAYQEAGVDVKGHGASYTGDMYDAFIASGFRNVTSQIDLKTGSGLIAGDVLLNEAHHAALAIGSGQIVQASLNEKGTTRGGQTGDQTGREIYTRMYYNYPWNYVLRIDGYSGFGQITTETGVSVLRAIPVSKKSWTTEYERDG